MARRRRIAILGTAGVPGRYGGFETLAENLVRYHDEQGIRGDLAVYCSARTMDRSRRRFLGAELRYVYLPADGVWAPIYDVLCLLDAARRKTDVILLLGVPGALALPLIKKVTRARVVTNIDGIEWRRAKWNWLARAVLRLSERLAVRYSDAVIADNQGIVDHVAAQYGVAVKAIPYGGDHALQAAPDTRALVSLPDRYALALCRVEPENNVAMILQAWAEHPMPLPLVFVGNWDKTAFGRRMKVVYGRHPHIHMRDAIYDAGSLRAIRDRAALYIHGHGAGGTNPSLVEMMHFGIQVCAFDCCFNRHTTEDQALFFDTATSLVRLVQNLDRGCLAETGRTLREIAKRRYTWEQVGKSYFDVLER